MAATYTLLNQNKELKGTCPNCKVTLSFSPDAFSWYMLRLVHDIENLQAALRDKEEELARCRETIDLITASGGASCPRST